MQSRTKKKKFKSNTKKSIIQSSQQFASPNDGHSSYSHACTQTQPQTTHLRQQHAPRSINTVATTASASMAGIKRSHLLCDQLIEAAQYGHVSKVNEILNLKCYSMTEFESISAAFLMAAQVGSLAICQLILQRLSRELHSRLVNPGLILAAKRGHLRVCKYLLSRGADVETRGMKGETALLIAADNNQRKVCRYLLYKAGANVLGCDQLGNGVLHIACKRGFIRVAKIVMLYCNARNIRSLPFTVNAQQCTPIQMCRCEELIRLILTNVITQAQHTQMQTHTNAADAATLSVGVDIHINDNCGGGGGDGDVEASAPSHAQTHSSTLSAIHSYLQSQSQSQSQSTATPTSRRHPTVAYQDTYEQSYADHDDLYYHHPHHAHAHHQNRLAGHGKPRKPQMSSPFKPLSVDNPAAIPTTHLFWRTIGCGKDRCVFQSFKIYPFDRLQDSERIVVLTRVAEAMSGYKTDLCCNVLHECTLYIVFAMMQRHIQREIDASRGGSGSGASTHVHTAVQCVDSDCEHDDDDDASPTPTPPAALSTTSSLSANDAMMDGSEHMAMVNDGTSSSASSTSSTAANGNGASQSQQPPQQPQTKTKTQPAHSSHKRRRKASHTWRLRAFDAFEQLFNVDAYRAGLRVECTQSAVWNTVIDLLACSIFGDSFWCKKQMFLTSDALHRRQCLSREYAVDAAYWTSSLPDKCELSAEHINVMYRKLMTMSKSLLRKNPHEHIKSAENASLCFCPDCIPDRHVPLRFKLQFLEEEAEEKQKKKGKKYNHRKSLLLQKNSAHAAQNHIQEIAQLKFGNKYALTQFWSSLDVKQKQRITCLQLSDLHDILSCSAQWETLRAALQSYTTHLWDNDMLKLYSVSNNKEQMVVLADAMLHGHEMPLFLNRLFDRIVVLRKVSQTPKKPPNVRHKANEKSVFMIDVDALNQYCVHGEFDGIQLLNINYAYDDDDDDDDDYDDDDDDDEDDGAKPFACHEDLAAQLMDIRQDIRELLPDTADLDPTAATTTTSATHDHALSVDIGHDMWERYARKMLEQVVLCQFAKKLVYEYSKKTKISESDAAFNNILQTLKKTSKSKESGNKAAEVDKESPVGAKKNGGGGGGASVVNNHNNNKKKNKKDKKQKKKNKKANRKTNKNAQSAEKEQATEAEHGNENENGIEIEIEQDVEHAEEAEEHEQVEVEEEEEEEEEEPDEPEPQQPSVVPETKKPTKKSKEKGKKNKKAKKQKKKKDVVEIEKAKLEMIDINTMHAHAKFVADEMSYASSACSAYSISKPSETTETAETTEGGCEDFKEELPHSHPHTYHDPDHEHVECLALVGGGDRDEDHSSTSPSSALSKHDRDRDYMGGHKHHHHGMSIAAAIDDDRKHGDLEYTKKRNGMKPPIISRSLFRSTNASSASSAASSSSSTASTISSSNASNTSTTTNSQTSFTSASSTPKRPSRPPQCTYHGNLTLFTHRQQQQQQNEHANHHTVPPSHVHTASSGGSSRTLNQTHQKPKTNANSNHKNSQPTSVPSKKSMANPPPPMTNTSKAVAAAEDSWTTLSRLTEGAMFICSNETFEECMQIKLLGLPKQYLKLVQELNPAKAALFLFNMTDRMLYGVYQATERGAENISPVAWARNKSSARFSPFPAQVPFRVVYEFQPLPEASFRHMFNDGNRIRKLDDKETKEILAMYRQTLSAKLQTRFRLHGERASSRTHTATSSSSSSATATTLRNVKKGAPAQNVWALRAKKKKAQTTTAPNTSAPATTTTTATASVEATNVCEVQKAKRLPTKPPIISILNNGSHVTRNQPPPPVGPTPQLESPRTQPLPPTTESSTKPATQKEKEETESVSQRQQQQELDVETAKIDLMPPPPTTIETQLPDVNSVDVDEHEHELEPELERQQHHAHTSLHTQQQIIRSVWGNEVHHGDDEDDDADDDEEMLGRRLDVSQRAHDTTATNARLWANSPANNAVWSTLSTHNDGNAQLLPLTPPPPHSSDSHSDRYPSSSVPRSDDDANDADGSRDDDSMRAFDYAMTHNLHDIANQIIDEPHASPHLANVAVDDTDVSNLYHYVWNDDDPMDADHFGLYAQQPHARPHNAHHHIFKYDHGTIAATELDPKAKEWNHVQVVPPPPMPSSGLSSTSNPSENTHSKPSNGNHRLLTLESSSQNASPFEMDAVLPNIPSPLSVETHSPANPAASQYWYGATNGNSSSSYMQQQPQHPQPQQQQQRANVSYASYGSQQQQPQQPYSHYQQYTQYQSAAPRNGQYPSTTQNGAHTTSASASSGSSPHAWNHKQYQQHHQQQQTYNPTLYQYYQQTPSTLEPPTHKQDANSRYYTHDAPASIDTSSPSSARMYDGMKRSLNSVRWDR